MDHFAPNPHTPNRLLAPPQPSEQNILTCDLELNELNELNELDNQTPIIEPNTLYFFDSRSNEDDSGGEDFLHFSVHSFTGSDIDFQCVLDENLSSSFIHDQFFD